MTNTKTTTYKLYLGLNDKDTKLQKYDIVEAYKVANSIVLSHCEGATIYNGNGIYKHENGQVVVEQTLIIEISGASESSVASVIEDLKRVFNQECVLVEKSASSRAFL